jgi:hypothetical protein
LLLSPLPLLHLLPHYHYYYNTTTTTSRNTIQTQHICKTFLLLIMSQQPKRNIYRCLWKKQAYHYNANKVIPEYHSLSKSKVKKSYIRNRPWSPMRLCDVKDPTFSRRSVHRWRQGC